MPTEIERDAAQVLATLAEWQESEDEEEKGNHFVSGAELAGKTGLDPQRINRAVAFLAGAAQVETLSGIGTAPYEFSKVRPLVLGHVEAQRSTAGSEPTEIEKDATLVLRTLAEWIEDEDQSRKGQYQVSGRELTEKLGLRPRRVNRAVELLETQGYVHWLRAVGTVPYVFSDTRITPEGHLALQQLDEAQEEERRNRIDVFLSHSNVDDKLCADIASLLRYSGLKVFATPASIPTGKWEEQIEEALQNAATVWVLLPPNALSRSVWTHHEFAYFYGFRHGKGMDKWGNACRFLYSEDGNLPGLYGHIQGTPVDSFDNPVLLAQSIADALDKTLDVPADWTPQQYAVQGPPALPWTRLAGGPVFKLSPGVDSQGGLLCTFQIEGDPSPGGVEARWTGAGVSMDWVRPMNENVPPGSRFREYQMKPVQANPASQSDTVSFEVRFYLSDNLQHVGRWSWPLAQHPRGAWILEPGKGSGGSQPKDEDAW